MKILGKEPTLGPGVTIDVDRLIATRMLIQANSGGGKSWAIRRILEQTYGACQHVVVDVEGEFHSLRQKFDYVLAAPSGGDCRVDVDSAPLLARRILELNVSVIIDVYELGLRRAQFMSRFLNALVNAPRALWHPLMIVLDEAQKFCTEGVRSESGAAVEAIMTLGRKRGFCPILATQRISELRKSAAAECNNKLIGRCGLDVDMARAGRELGFRRREDIASLRDLAPGEFYALGPALSTVGVARVKIGPVQTTHPEAGQGAAPPTPPSDRIRAILAELGDLPASAAEEAQTIEALQAKVGVLEQDLQSARSAKSAGPEVRVVERIVDRPVMPAAVSARIDLLADHVRDLDDVLARLSRGVAEVGEDLRELRAAATATVSPGVLRQEQPRERRPNGGPNGAPVKAPIRTPEASAKVPTRAPAKAASETGDLSAAQVRLLEALVFLESIGEASPRTEAVAFLAGYNPRGGAFTGMRGHLRARGLVDYPSPGTTSLTQLGRGSAPRLSAPASGAELRKRVLERISEIERRLLSSLIEAYPRSLSVAELAAQNHYEARGGAFTGARGRLRMLGLASYPGPGLVRAADLLFPSARPPRGSS